MSRIEELIDELCPNGVEYKRVSDLCNVSRGIVISKQYIENNKGDYPVYSSQTENNGELGRINAYRYDGEYLTWTTDGANAGSVFYRNGKFSVTNVCGLLEKKISTFNLKFLYYVLTIEAPKHVNRGMGNPKLMSNIMSDITVPVPPRPIQDEIVRILDKFTELTAELTVELTARKRQYEYYRNRLLEQPKNVCSMVAISELGKWSGGKTPSTANKEYWENGTIPWISSKDMKNSTLEDTEDHLTKKALEDGGMKLFPEGIVAIVTRSGILKHTFPIAYVPFRTTVNQDIKALIVKDGISSRYVFHAMQAYAEDIRKSTKKQGGTVDSLDFQRLLAYKIPVPTLEIQNRLADVLDNFESICSDLNIGLPAEIELRKKQYEFYRDALLTFAETGNIIAQTDRQTDRH